MSIVEVSFEQVDLQSSSSDDFLSDNQYFNDNFDGDVSKNFDINIKLI